jgi:hypothetical protein
VRIDGAARQHFHAVERDAPVVFRGHPQRGLWQPLGQVVILVACALRRDDRIGREQVVSPDMLVNSQQIVAAPAGLAVEHLGLQGKAGKIAGEGVGRTSHQTETEVRDLTVGTVAAPQIFLGPRL